jgi:KDO2-lipid IV(A) lauroyltransferase
MRNPFRRLHTAVPRLRRLLRRLKISAGTAAASFALWAVGRLSLEQALRLGERAGALLYRVLRTPRSLALEHLQVAFADQLTPTGREHLARASFTNIARSFCELAKLDEIRRRRVEYFEVDGWEHVRALLAGGKGAIIITGQIGNWELLGAFFAWHGLAVATITRRFYDQRVNRLLVDFRRRQGVETISSESPHATRQILEAVKQNGLLTMVIDREPPAPPVSLPFFGRPARTPAAAAALAIRRQLPVAAVFIQRRGQGGHRISVSPPFAIEHSDDTQADIVALTRQFNAALDAQIRKNPAEWVWWHRRWRRAPLGSVTLRRWGALC